MFNLELDGNEYVPVKYEVKESPEAVNLVQRMNYFLKLDVHFE